MPFLVCSLQTTITFVQRKQQGRFPPFPSSHILGQARQQVRTVALAANAQQESDTSLIFGLDLHLYAKQYK